MSYTPPRPKKATLSRQKRRNIRKWIEALRSGEYAQGNGELKSVLTDLKGDPIPDMPPAYCCLGVLGEVTGQELDDGILTNNVMIHPLLLDSLTGLAQVDPSEYKRRGDPVPVSDILNLSYAEHLASKNDGGSTFNQIATWIERRTEAIHPGWRDGL